MVPSVPFARPLVVDLDGTLLRTDSLHESAIRLLRDRPFDLLRVPFWLIRGKAVLKRKIAHVIKLDPASLPYRTDLLAWLAEEHAAGRRLVLCTASDAAVARAIADHIGLFDEVIASDGVTNLAGARKAATLVERFGVGGFDYAGNSGVDLFVWQSARCAIVVDASAQVAREARERFDIEREFSRADPRPTVWSKVLRLHQWLKNLLLFVPLLAAHRYDDGYQWLSLVFAFFAFGLCASTVYVVNDLFDLESDRRHPRKRLRPFASGSVPVWQGVAVAPVLLAGSAVFAAQVGSAFVFWLITYFMTTCAYSWGLKRIVLIDCLLLAVLYTLRIVAGGAATALDLSFWLLAFSVFLFMSLAFVKRYAELLVQAQSGDEKAHGRGYLTADAPLVQAFGVASGYSAVLVLALYLNSDAVLRLYGSAQVVGTLVPILLFWISWVWLQAHRGRMHDDPLVFAVKDRASLAVGFVLAAVLVIASLGV